MMNAARIHNKHKLKSFWEQKIVLHEELMDEEEKRVRNSALTRLRDEWTFRLDQRNQNQKSFFEERIKRSEKVQQRLEKLASP
ncbi:hypothetical protein LDENG_00190080 [Lucifuga dentata]|nr:hypothetical protein LDENG_00190080 [Lucifuga dentata]